jgi:quercetin dioxygenase-like cupin family protein
MESILSRRDALAVLVALGVPAGTPKGEEHGGNGLEARLTFENDRVRVLEYASAAGEAACGTERHYHPAHLTIYLTPVKVRGHKDDGTTTVAERKAGEVAWFEAGWHASENIGPGPARLCMVELKDAAWKPSTGTSPRAGRAP